MSKGEPISKMRSLNILLVLLTCAASLWAWVSLPDLLRYPVHWNIHGDADAFGSKGAVLFNLSIMPVTAMFTQGLFWWVAKQTSAKEVMGNSTLALDIVENSGLWLFLIINVFIVKIYMGLDVETAAGTMSPTDINISLRLVPIFLAVVFILIGNVLPKFRQNYFIGVRTPWTLKSKATWEATHRISARLMVGAGVLVLLAQLFTSPEAGLFAAIALILAAVLGSLFYSYVYYQSAPDRQN